MNSGSVIYIYIYIYIYMTEPLVETNDEHDQIELDESNITDNRKARKKMKALTYSEVVKGTERKDIGEKVINLEEIKANVLRDTLNQTYETTPPVLCCDSSICKNSSEQLGFNQQSFGDVLSSQDDELVGIFEDLQNEKLVNINPNCSDDTRISGYFCSDTVFNLSHRVLSEDEIKVLEKGLDFAPIQKKVNEPELRKDFDEFCRRMRIKWLFRNEPSENFSTISVFRSKSSWKPPTGHPTLEVFLSSVEKGFV